jgi:hypothetical protein
MNELRELIKEVNGRVQFPALCGCAVCGGLLGYYSMETGSVNDKELVYVQQALDAYGEEARNRAANS